MMVSEKRGRNAGVTLMELLVVLLIIGVLGAVAVRTIDATRGRALFDQTAAEMEELVHAIVGNPEMTLDGRRLDFGYYGDLGELPYELRHLVTNPGDPRWRGPYLRRAFLGDSVSFLYDAWANPYTYDRTTGVIATIGDGKHPMTVRVADTLLHLTRNTIVGTVSDADNNPPHEMTPLVIRLHLSSGPIFTEMVDAGGYYEFAEVPIGTHRLVAHYLQDSITRWVSVAPRSRNVVDFRFGKPFANFLGMVGQPQLDDTTGFMIAIVNRHELELSITDVEFIGGPDSAYFRALTWNGELQPGYDPLPGDGFGRGTPPMPINRANPAQGRWIQGKSAELVLLGFHDCRVSKDDGGANANISGQSFTLRFNEGSVIEVQLPSP